MSRRILAALALVALLAPTRASAAEAIGPEEAVARALENNPGLAAVVAERRSASWQVVFEDAAFAPSLLLQAGWAHAEQPVVTTTGSTNAGLDSLSFSAGLARRLRLGTDIRLTANYFRRWQEEVAGGGGGFLAVGPVYDTSLRLDLTQPLLRGAGRAVNEAALRSARLQSTASERTAERSASELVRDVLVAWWELWYADEAHRIEEEALALAERQRDEAQRRIELGSEAPVEVLTFETRVAERKEGVALAARDRRTRALALSALLGGGSAELEAGTPNLAPIDLEEAGVQRELAVQMAPEVREAQVAVELASLEAQTATDPWRSRLDLQGYAEAGVPSEAFLGFGNDAEIAWTAGLNLIYELPLTGRRREAATQQAQLAVQAAERRLEQARLSVERTIEEEIARFESARARAELARRTVEVAEAQLAAERRRYEIGTGTPLQVLEAEDAVRSARLRLVRAEVDLRTAAASAEHLSGLLLERWVAPDRFTAAN